MLHSFPSPISAVVQGSSRGIGLALVEALLEQEGVGQVIACARRPQDSVGLAELAGRFGSRLQLQALDITVADQIAALAADLRRQQIRPQLVINVAGLLHDGAELMPEKRLEDIEFERMQRVFAVNTLGPAQLLRHLLPIMSNQGKAAFVVLSARVGSIADNRLGGWYAYRASKAALNQIVKTAAIEAQRRFRNVVLAALHPGTTDTRLSKPFQANVPPERLFSPRFVAEQLLQRIDELSLEQSGGFFAWDGQEIPW